MLAIQRAYKRAGFGIDTVAYFEGHGTGTSVGDATELQALSRARREAQPGAPPAAIGSIKGNIGHTKAAAGIAGLIKATLALHAQIVPPTTGCETPHALVADADSALRVLKTGEIWPDQQALRAGVSAMGFGGINTHIVLEAATTMRRSTLTTQEEVLLASAQDAELFLLSAEDSAGLQQQIAPLLRFAAELSRAELADLAAHLAGSLAVGRVRAAIVATSPAELASRLELLRTWLEQDRSAQLDVGAGVFLGTGARDLRIGFLFPGQGSPSRLDGGALARRFAQVRALYERADFPKASVMDHTAVAQPAIVTGSLAALGVLEQLGVQATVAVGHSLGELTALHWAGALSQPGVLRIAGMRGRIMADLGSPDGAMASIAANSDEVAELLPGDGVVIAGLNSPRQTVISGQASVVTAVMSRAAGQGFLTTRLPVSHAFHSPLIAAAAQPLAEYLRTEEFQSLRRTVISTVTGATLSQDADLRTLLYRQITSPVRFTEAVATAGKLAALLIEVGPGQVLSRLAAEPGLSAVIATDSGGESLQGILGAVGAAFALGAPINHQKLFADRFTRPFSIDWQPRFFTNPCELAPVPQATVVAHTNGHRNGRVAKYAAYEAVVGEPRRQLPATRAWEPVAAEVDASRAPSTAGTPLRLIHQLVAECAELPFDAVQDDSHLLSDLHLNSIAVSQIVVLAAQQLGLPRPANPTEYADATVADVARALEELVRTGSAEPVAAPPPRPAGIDSWVRTFGVELVEQPLLRSRPADGSGTWQFLSPPTSRFVDRLRQAFARAGVGHGVVVCLPPAPDERAVSLLLEGARIVLQQQPARFVLVQHGGGAASFARTLYQEANDVRVCVVDVPPEHPQAADWVVAEALAVVEYAEVYYDTDGRRREPVLRLLPDDLPAADAPLGGADVLLVTGGGKGITAECALALACDTGARLALLGRSRPAEDAELSANLERMQAAGIQLRYYSVDITQKDAVAAVIRRVDAELGPVTALLHGAARNVPQLLHSLDEATVLQTLAPKITGLRNVLAAIDPGRLRLLLSFGSIIARMGLRGEADYALANEWLTRLTEQWQTDHPHCRCLAIEWSIWSEVGMGARLGGVDSLMRAGITPISPDRGIALLRQLLSRRLAQPAVVVTGRFGDPLTLQMQKPELPFLRFLEQPRAYYPGIELIVDAELSAKTDPYLDDHQFAGQLIFPAVMGLEAMAQVSRALAETETLPHFVDVQFKRPIVVPKQAALTIRVAALVQEPGRIEIAIRSEETAFQVDHFRATCCFGAPELPSEPATTTTIAAQSFEPLPRLGIDPQRDLYSGLLFHRGRFQRIVSYQHLAATECIAEIDGDKNAAWFGYYLPPSLALGDPGVRDAAIHAIQACVPNATLLPVGVERVILHSAAASGSVLVHARERIREGDTFTYDMEVITPDGTLLERWEGLKLRIVGGTEFRGAWVEPLLGPWLERQIHDLIPGSQVSVAVEHDPTASRRDRSDLAIQRALRQSAPIWRRPDGKVDATGARAVSAAHSSHITLAVAGANPLGCDLEPVAARPLEVWEGLLGHDRVALAQVIAAETGEDEAVSATRAWAAAECLKKAGAMVDAPLLFVASTDSGAVLLASGSLTIVTFVTQVRSTTDRLVFAVLVGNSHARL
ncbi:MAG TPA: SDR family NAD(P)-dependent oxidoreductase [Herpetosiphonaceae bacterium]